MTKNNCFICLNSCTNKVCPTCTCVAHPKCWGKYVNNEYYTYSTIINAQLVVITPYDLECPICKSDILYTKPLTRSAARDGEERFIKMFMYSYFKALSTIQNPNYAEEYLTFILKFIIPRRKFWIDNKNLVNIVKSALHDMSWWNMSNFYHLEIFKEPIKI